MKTQFKVLIVLLLISFSVCAQKTNHYLEGLALLQSNKYTESVQAFDKAINDSPNDGKLLLNRGIAQLNAGNNSLAEKDLLKALSFGLNESNLWLAKLEAKNNNAKQSVDYLKNYLQEASEHNKTDVFKDKAFSQIKESDEWFNLVSKNYQTTTSEITKQVDYYYKKQNWDAGIKYLSEKITEHTTLLELYYYRAQLYYEAEKYALSIIDCKKALKDNINNTDYHLLLANSYSENKEYSKAQAHYQAVIEHSPESFNTYLKLAKTQKNTSNIESARKTIDSYANYFPNDTAARYLSAEIYYEASEYNKALTDINALMAKHDAHADWFLLRGMCYMQTGTTKYAAEDLSMCLDLAPSNKTANLQLGVAMHKLGKASSACYYWERALRYGELKATEYLLEFCE